MSPDEIKRAINRRQMVTVVLSLAVSLIVVFTTRALNISDSEAKSLNDKIDNKADKPWVEEKIQAHEQTDAARYQGIKDMFVITSSQLKEIKEDIREIRKNQN